MKILKNTKIINFEKFENFSFTVTSWMLLLIHWFSGIASWGYPVFTIWTDIIDKKFALIGLGKSIVIGLVFLIINFGTGRIFEIIDKEE